MYIRIVASVRQFLHNLIAIKYRKSNFSSPRHIFSRKVWSWSDTIRISIIGTSMGGPFLVFTREAHTVQHILSWKSQRSTVKLFHQVFTSCQITKGSFKPIQGYMKTLSLKYWDNYKSVHHVKFLGSSHEQTEIIQPKIQRRHIFGDLSSLLTNCLGE